MNIEVFGAVDSHQEYRLQVRETVWDDALFEQYYAIVDYERWELGLLDERTSRPVINEYFREPEFDFLLQDPVN